jgi:hypothetical protein
VNAVCIIPSEVALLVRWKTHIESANPVMLDARMEIACPSKTIVRPRIPDGRLEEFRVDIIFTKILDTPGFYVY